MLPAETQMRKQEPKIVTWTSNNNDSKQQKAIMTLFEKIYKKRLSMTRVL